MQNGNSRREDFMVRKLLGLRVKILLSASIYLLPKQKASQSVRIARIETIHHE